MVDLNTLIILAKVVDAGSFSEAARLLKMPVSKVNRRIAELEDQLGVRLLEQSTRSLRLTDVGGEVLEHARRGADISDTIDSVISNQLSKISGTLRLSAPPNLSDSLLALLIGAFQASYPDVRIQVFVTDRLVDHIAEGVDLVFRIGPLKDSSLVARKLLTYRHQLVASPAYLETCRTPITPKDLLDHRLLAFPLWKREQGWDFIHQNGRERERLRFLPYLAMNDYNGLASALLAGVGIGELPPIVRPGLVRDRHLVEVMPNWRFRAVELAMVHIGNRHMPRPVRVFTEFAARMARSLFPDLPV